MDQAQKKKLDSVADELARDLNPHDFARLLEESDLISSDIFEDVMNNADSNYLRNIKLLNAVQDGQSKLAYQQLMHILEELAPSIVQRLVKNSSPTRNLLGALMNRFKPKNDYPLGLSSGQSRPKESYESTVAKSSDGLATATSVTSPFKEVHQTTLISSHSSNSNQTEPPPGYSSPQTEFRLQRTNPKGPPFRQTERPRLNDLPAGNMPAVSRFSQTPSRLNELNLTRHQLNSSLPEENQQQQQQQQICPIGGRQLELPLVSEEPVVSWHPYAQSPVGENASRAGSPHLCHTCYSSASSESGESSSDSLFIDPNLILNPNVMTAIAREGPNMMTVKPALVCHNDPEEDYKMTSQPRGLCLIVNNIKFEDDIFPTRKGSDEDANRFDQIFRQLGFQTVMTRNLTAEQMRDKFAELSVACKPEHDALFVFILSHGSEHGIFGTDGIEVRLESEIISCFDNRNCKAMIGKPKVFVIQACRGRTKDCGGGGDGDATDSIAWQPVTASPSVRHLSQQNRVPDSWLPSSQPSERKNRKHPIRTDMLLVFSCLAGFVSVRNETAGSWLGVALAYNN